MNSFNSVSVGFAVAPTVVSTLVSHYLDRKPRRQRPTAHLSYDEGLHLVRSFLDSGSHHTIEEFQAFTAQWVPHPQWVKVKATSVPEVQLNHAAKMLQSQLGPDGLRQIGGVKWWQWRKANAPLDAEWIEMRSDYSARKAAGGHCERVMLYVHGGAYFFGSIDTHRYQMQRYARKLNARVFAPNYRLAPQYPFPCGLQDCLAAYLYLLTLQDANTIVLAGDSAGGGMVVSLLCLLRDQGLPLPAGGILISPWVDLTHSFPSISEPAPFDYIPQHGFHHKPSKAWPPPNADDIAMLREEAWKAKNEDVKKTAGVRELKEKQQDPVVEDGSSPTGTSRSAWINGGVPIIPDELITIEIDGVPTKIKDQVQIYTTNDLLAHPLVSPVMQPTLGGLPPLLVMAGGGEILRDEQIYFAHKCANPEKYAGPPGSMDEKAREALKRFKPTDVQLQVWDDLCHVAPTLSFTRPAKYMFRSAAQFGAWALARAQKKGIDIMDDDKISVISRSGSEDGSGNAQEQDSGQVKGQVGKAGDPLPRFKDHMIRQRVTRHGDIFPLAAEADLPGCCVPPESVGVVKERVVKTWLQRRKEWDDNFATAKAKVHKKTVKDMVAGYHDLGPGENPPPTALAGRRRIDEVEVRDKKQKSMGLAFWSLLGSKHDEMAVQREQKANEEPEVRVATPAEGQGARSFADIEAQERPPLYSREGSRSRSRHRVVVDEGQTDNGAAVNEHTPVAQLLEIRREKEAAGPTFLSPDYVPETGAAGKRPHLDGIAVPFSLGKEADTASMVTLQSDASPAPGSPTMSPSALSAESTQMTSQHEDDKETMGQSGEVKDFAEQNGDVEGGTEQNREVREAAEQNGDVKEGTELNGTVKEKTEQNGGLNGYAKVGTPETTTERPGIETFITAAEDLPRATTRWHDF